MLCLKSWSVSPSIVCHQTKQLYVLYPIRTMKRSVFNPNPNRMLYGKVESEFEYPLNLTNAIFSDRLNLNPTSNPVLCAGSKSWCNCTNIPTMKKSIVFNAKNVKG